MEVFPLYLTQRIPLRRVKLRRLPDETIESSDILVDCYPFVRYCLEYDKEYAEV